MSKALQLLCLKAAAPQFDASKGVEGLPQRILVMPWGAHDTAKGKVICNEATVHQLSAYNAKMGWDRPALDFEHNSVNGSPTYQGEPVKVAGYGSLQVVAGEGIYLLMSSWTQEGKDYAAGGHYGDLSPVVQVNERDEIIGVHSAALCRHGATPGVIFLSSSTPTPPTMDPKPPQTADELMTALKTALGLGADTAPAEVLKALTAKLSAAPAPAEGSEEMKQLTALVTNLSETVKGQGESMKTLSASLEAGQRGEVMAQAAREGKEVPAVAADLPIDKLKLLCAQLPVTVPLEKRAATLNTLMLSSLPVNSADAEQVSKLTGVSEDDRKKYGAE